MKHLNERHALSSFVIWGRSMGAVATLLYGTSLESINENTQISAMVKCMVLDSPFSNFKEISRQIALTRMSIPSFIADLALRYVEDAFDNLLTDK